MSQRLVSFSENEFYHVYNRGTDKRTIYLDKSDYKRFMELLYLSNSRDSFVVRDIYRNYRDVYEFDRDESLVAIGAYCLMPNHYHILITPLVENGVTKFMNKLGTSYAMYFNKKYERTGALFQGRFRAEHADSDEYLKYLFSYIHLNPVKLIDPTWKEEGIKDSGKAFDYSSTYPCSSLQDYLGKKRQESLILDSSHFPEYFPTNEDARTEIFDWFNYKDQN